MAIPTYLWVQTAALGITFVILCYQRMRHKIIPLNLILMIIGLALFRSIVETIFKSDFDLDNPGGKSQVIVQGLAVLAFYIYVEAILNDKPPLLRFALVFFLFGGFISTYWLNALLENNYRIGPADLLFWEFFFDLFQFSCFATTTYAAVRMTRFSPTTKSRSQSFILTISSLFFLLSAIIELQEWITGIKMNSAVTTTPAFFFISVLYILFPNYAYSTPVTIHRLIVVHDTGPPIIEVKFHKGEPQIQKSASMMGGVTSALDSLLKEIMSNTGSIRLAAQTSSVLMFETAPQIITVLAVDHPTRLLRMALHSFSREFSQRFSKELLNFKGALWKFDGYKFLITQYFPFSK
ncbi:MAG: hypothetical protein ACXAB7_10755 [Candidatus Kariarchaeaceae archaeon]|jgi:hypothetical protein